MAHIRFSIQVDTEDEEPSRVVRQIEGTVYDYEGESDTEKQIGDLRCFLVQPGLAEEKQIHLFDAMDSINDETVECYEAVFDLVTNDYNADIEDLYAGGPVGVDLLFIEQIRVDERHRGKGIGRNVVREIIETFGLQFPFGILRMGREVFGRAFAWLLWTIFPLAHMAWVNGLPRPATETTAPHPDEHPASPVGTPPQH
jgi:GNAT superfamily N-acetyltransferase